jgi:Xaa-Pro dipeptidase
MFPDYQKRVANLQSIMSPAGLKAAVLTGQGSLIYFGGVLIPWRTALVIGESGDPALITNRYDVGRIRELTWIPEVIGWELFSDPEDFIRKIASALQARGVQKGSIGAEIDMGHVPGVLTAKEWIRLKEALPGVNIENILPQVQEIMITKDNYEIEQLRRAAEVSDVGMQAGFQALRPGISELSLMGIIENAMRNAGDLFTWSVTGNELGSGYRQRYPNCTVVMPANKIIQYGDMVTIDLHPMVAGYLGDLALNAIAGPPTPAIRRLADGWEEVVEVLVSALKPGRTVHEVASATETAVQKRKLEAFCSPFYGHGLGTDARIPPVIVKGNQRVLKPRMVVEALLQITDPEVGGLRLEVPVLITEKGNEVLCKTPLKLHVRNNP